MKLMMNFKRVQQKVKRIMEIKKRMNIRFFSYIVYENRKNYFKIIGFTFMQRFQFFLIMFIVYLSQGILAGIVLHSLLGDGFHQYVIFDTTLRNILHSRVIVFLYLYKWIRFKLYALTSYYLGSFLSFCLFLQFRKYARCCLSLYLD